MKDKRPLILHMQYAFHVTEALALKAEEGTLRKMYGLSIDKNSVHGSDSPTNAKIEIDFFFK